MTSRVATLRCSRIDYDARDYPGRDDRKIQRGIEEREYGVERIVQWGIVENSREYSGEYSME